MTLGLLGAHRQPLDTQAVEPGHHRSRVEQRPEQHVAGDAADALDVQDPAHAPADLRAHRARTREYARERKQLNRLRREPSRTLDGIDIKLWANAESREDVAEAHALGAAGVGLYRTEFLFLNSAVLPDEDLLPHVLDRARALAAGPRVALGLMKANLAVCLSADLEAAMDVEVAHHTASKATADHAEAARAFVERRPARFTGR